jgi:RNA polymerase sigma-70 factor (ECF subfamily)
MTFQNSDPNCLEYRVAAAAKIFGDHGSFIRIVIRSHVQDKDLADDLFQDFFLSLISKPLPRSLENVKGYLYRAITNDIVDATRRMIKYRAYMREYAERSKRSDSQKTPKETLQEMEQAEIVLKIIDERLPCSEAEAVSLRYLDSHKVKEIATTMGVANTTARIYVNDAIDRIRRLSGDIETHAAE